MSPEQFRGQELDMRSDIYSLGVMAYEMLTGRLPFDADTPWAWATQHMTAQPFPFETVPLGSQVPAKMKAAVMRALSKDKTQRQQTVKEFYEEFTMGGGRTSGISMPMRASGGDFAASSGAVVGGNTGPMASAQTQPGTAMMTPGQGMDRVSSPSGAGYTSSPGMPVGGVPTGSAQIMPPPAPQKKGGSGVLIGVIAVVGVGAIVGAAFAFKGKGNGKTGDTGTATSATTTTASATPSAEPPDAGASEPTDAGTTAPTNKPPTQPPTSQAAEAACKSAQAHAARDDLSGARSAMASCSGNSRVAAQVAIQQAEIRERERLKHQHRQPPCTPRPGRPCPPHGR
jgi:serine/threonine-protein kinase